MVLSAGLVLKLIALVVFVLVAFGVTISGATTAEEIAAGLAFLTAGLIVA